MGSECEQRNQEIITMFQLISSSKMMLEEKGISLRYSESTSHKTIPKIVYLGHKEMATPLFLIHWIVGPLIKINVKGVLQNIYFPTMQKRQGSCT